MRFFTLPYPLPSREEGLKTFPPFDKGRRGGIIKELIS